MQKRLAKSATGINMSGTFEQRQARIDALLQQTQIDRIQIEKGVLQLAHTGITKPKALTVDDIQTICYALIIHYRQMGIE